MGKNIVMKLQITQLEVFMSEQLENECKHLEDILVNVGGA